jgi:hypothetical protein
MGSRASRGAGKSASMATPQEAQLIPVTCMGF